MANAPAKNAPTAAPTTNPIEVAKPLPEKDRVPMPIKKFTYADQTEAKVGFDKCRAIGKRVSLYSVNIAGKTCYTIEFGPRAALGRAAEFLGYVPSTIEGMKSLKAPRMATPDQFVNQFASMSDDDRKKILEALKGTKV